jgi:hypothetical protein
LLAQGAADQEYDVDSFNDAVVAAIGDHERINDDALA